MSSPTPSGPPTPVSAANTRVTDLLAVTAGPTGHCEYVIGGSVAASDLTKAAHLLADYAMEIRCGAAPALQLWRQRVAGGPAHTGRDHERVAAFVRIGFGLPAEPGDDGHLQGHVSELLWGRVVNERLTCLDGRTLVHATDVKADVAEPGGDGVVVYEIAGGTLVFRAWEIKKHEQSGALSGTIGRASEQLRTRGTTYLAKLTAPGTLHPGPLGALFAEMVDLWLDESPRAGVGVSVATSARHAPTSSRPFKSLATKFPNFSAPGQREGIVIAVPNFTAFATEVREVVWKGL